MTGRRERLDETEISQRLTQSAWARDGESIQRTFRLATFRDALRFVNAVGQLADERDHHPDIDIRWNRERTAERRARADGAMDSRARRAP